MKALSPASRRAYAPKAVEGGVGSGRKVCRILTVPRSSYWYRPKEKTSWEQDFLKRAIELSEKPPRYGYCRIATLLRHEGWHAGKRRIQSMRRSLGLRVPPSKRKMVRRGDSTGLPVKPSTRAMSGPGTSCAMEPRVAGRSGGSRSSTSIPASAMCCGLAGLAGELRAVAG